MNLVPHMNLAPKMNLVPGRAAFAALGLALLITGCTSARQPVGPEAHASDGPPALYEGYADVATAYRRPTSTTSSDAQRWFDQGLMLLYGFNHDEAIRSFRKSAEVDPSFGLAWWGVAYAYGLHISNPAMSEVQSRRAHAAVQEALGRVESAWPVERALIEAVATRYEWPVPPDRSQLDAAYAESMEKVWRAFPNDPDVGALFAESVALRSRCCARGAWAHRELRAFEREAARTPDAWVVGNNPHGERDGCRSSHASWRVGVSRGTHRGGA